MINKKAKRGTDPRYKVVKSLIKSGDITSLDRIFEDRYITLTLVAKDAGIPPATLSRKKSKVDGLTLYEMEGLSTAFDIDFNTFTDFLRGIKKK